MRPLFLGIGGAMIGVILWLSLTPQPPQVDFEHSDKVGHFLAYGGLMFWFCQIYRASRARIACAAAFIAMGIAIEFVQGGTGYPSFEAYDMGAEAIGGLA